MRWWLDRLVGKADRQAIENDLAELYELRRRQDGDRAAARWLRRQQRLYPLRLLASRVRTAAADRASTLPHLWRDLAYSVRTLVRTPAMAATIVLTIGVGLGATTAMVSVVRAVLVNPLPYAAADSIVWIYTDNPPYRFRFSVVDYRALEADHPTFSAVAGYQTNRVTITDGGIAERVNAKDVTGSYFPLLGQRARLGRLFDGSDDARRQQIVVLSYDYWTRRFGRDPGVLGRTMTIDGASFTIVGVLERTDGPLEHDVAVFTAAHWPPPTRKGPFFTMAIGRLAPGVSRTAAIEALRATNARLFPIWKSSYQDEKATWGVQDLKSRVVGDIGATLFVVLAAVGCVLLIACANAVNLLIARALGRSRDLAIRGALGASRGRLVQSVLAEAGVLTVGAALVGLAVAAGAVTLVATYGAAYIPRIDEVRLSPPVLAWLGALAAAGGLLIGLVPALYSVRLRMDRALASSGRSASDGPAPRRLRRALVAAEFALATPLIVAAVLVAASLDKLGRVQVGVETSHLLTAAVSLSGPRYSQEDGRASFWKLALDRVAALPGVQSAALADSRPPADSSQRNNFDLEDHPTPPGQNQPVCTWVGVSPAFFHTVGLPLERGRLLDDLSLQDDVVVVDRAWANRFFPGEEVLGRRFKSGGCTTCSWTTVVGVVGNVKWIGLDAQEDGTVYFPLVDVPSAFFTLRAAGDPAALARPLQQAMRELDPSLAVSNVATGDELVADSLAYRRYLTVLVGMFALTAFGLSVVGIYGVMAYFVQQHTRDIGIRLALGGEPAAVRRLVIWQGLRLVVIGVVFGVGGAFLAARLMTTVLFGVSPTNAGAMTAVPGALLIVAAVACLIPARRAASVDPATILREG
ncbi:MAG TPA: ABC transporter permease [Vicinamibacterales bacterium]|nr:ABC transporter permease [Vicinamibacterales bacterium]